MAEFAEDLQNFELSLPFLEMESNVELMNVIAELNPSMLDNTSLNEQRLMGFPNDSFFEHQQTVLPVNFVHNVPGSFHADGVVMAAQPESKKRKVMALSEKSSRNSCPPGSETALGAVNKTSGKNSLGRGKRGRSNDKALKKPNEVIHVRARRGQATDSHSLAERVRREKINEKLRSLQNLVPGCYKAMGMAVMLDEIINYVQSLKNQVDFLSMKLAAASSFYDFNSDNQTMGTIQGANAHEAQEMERLVREGSGGLSCFHSTWTF